MAARRIYRKNARIPPAFSNEMSAEMLSDKYVGTGKDIKRELIDLRQELIQKTMQDKKRDEKTATAYVNSHLIGLRRPAQGPSALYATPEGVRLWQQQYSRKKKGDVPPVQSGEVSARTLSKTYVGNDVTINRELAALRRELIADVVRNAGMDEETATANVEHFLIGLRQPHFGRNALHAMPDGQREWVRKYERQKKDNTPQRG